MTDIPIPKFKIGERIKPSQFIHVQYDVLKTPDICVHNDQPSYLLKARGPIETNPFHKSQVDVEEGTWMSVDNPPFLFPITSRIRHKKSGGLYRVVVTPDIGRLEATNTPAYSYVEDKLNGKVWHRCQEEMEDGRFELVHEKPPAPEPMPIRHQVSLRNLMGE